MNVSPSKENILKKIRKALSHSTPLPFPQSEGNNPFFNHCNQELEVEFAEQFTKLREVYLLHQSPGNGFSVKQPYSKTRLEKSLLPGR